MRERTRQDIHNLVEHYLSVFLLNGYVFKIFFKDEKDWNDPNRDGGDYSFEIERKFPYLDFNIYTSEKTEKEWLDKPTKERRLYIAHEVAHILLSGINHRATYYQNAELILEEEEQVCDLLAKAITTYESKRT